MTAIHLFILELLINVKPIAYPPRQASHSHSRYYLITVTAAMGLQEQCCNQVWCMQWLGSSSEKKPGWLSRLSLSKLLSLLARKGLDTAVHLYRKFLYNFRHFIKRATTYPKYLLFSEPMATLRFHLFWGITDFTKLVHQTKHTTVIYLLLANFFERMEYILRFSSVW